MKIEDKSFKKYLAYGLGEVVLLVLGILIALSISDWNDDRKEAANLRNVLKIFKTDIETDTLKATGLINYYARQDSLGRIVLNDSMQTLSAEFSSKAKSIIFTNYPYSLTKKGYNLLKTYSHDLKSAQDSVVIMGLGLYDSFGETLADITSKIAKDVEQNTLYMKEHQYFAADAYMRRTNPKSKIYYTSEDFKNRLAVNLQLKANNMNGQLISFNKFAKLVLNMIDKRLE